MKELNLNYSLRTPEEMGELIRCKREEKGISQQDLAEMLKITRKSISKWETGRGLPSIDIVPRLSHILDLTIESC